MVSDVDEAEGAPPERGEGHGRGDERGGEGGEEARRKVMAGPKDDQALQALPVPDRFTCVPESVRNGGAAYDVGQMWVRFAEGIRTGSTVDSDFDHAVRRHKTLDAIVRASQTGQRQKVG